MRLFLRSSMACTLLFLTPRSAMSQDAAPDAAPTDAIVTDALQGDGDPPMPCGQIIGRRCTPAGNECGTSPEASCLLVTQDEGVCTCSCTPDDPATPSVNEDDCPDPAKNICGEMDLSGYWVENFCFRKCQPNLGSSECEAPVSCDPRSVAYSGRLDQAVCLFVGCQSGDDCPVTTSKDCDPSLTGQCPTGQNCLPRSSSTPNIGVCTMPGNCDVPSGLCDKHQTTKPTAKVGDPCRSDLECGEYMTCFQQSDPATLGRKDHGASCFGDEECCGYCDPMTYACSGTCAVRARNGYCMIIGCSLATLTDYTEFACPTGSTCNRLFFGGICAKSCSLSNAADCRGHNFDLLGDYECRAWNEIELGGVKMSDSPICDFGYIARCNIWGTTGYDCTSLGEQGNPTNMGCRLLDGTKTSDPEDPRGFCLDDTSSGPPLVKPDAGPDGTPGDGPLSDGPEDDAQTTPDATEEPDAGILDMGDESDAAVFTDASVTPKDSRVVDAAIEKSDGGCSCALPAGSTGALWLLLALACLLPRRRRRGLR